MDSGEEDSGAEESGPEEASDGEERDAGDPEAHVSRGLKLRKYSAMEAHRRGDCKNEALCSHFSTIRSHFEALDSLGVATGQGESYNKRVVALQRIM